MNSFFSPASVALNSIIHQTYKSSGPHFSDRCFSFFFVYRRSQHVVSEKSAVNVVDGGNVCKGVVERSEDLFERRQIALVDQADQQQVEGEHLPIVQRNERQAAEVDRIAEHCAQ